MNIEPSYISKNKKTGIYYILINTSEKWTDYQINRLIEPNKIKLSFYYGVEYMPGQFEDEEEIFDIPIEEGFNSLDYKITSSQEKDQLIIVCIPRKLILNHKFFEKL